MKLDTHICLVSEQATPNLVPALDPKLRPRRVIQIVTPGMQRNAKWLQQALEQKHLRVEQWPLDDPWDIERIQTSLLELLDRERDLCQQKNIGLNVTGGTKPMSIAAHETCRMYELPIFYVHPEKDRLVWLYPEDRNAIDLDDRLKLETFLQAHGASVRNQPARNIADAGQLNVAQEIVRGIERYGKPLSTLNWLAANARQTLLSPPVKNDHGQLAELIDLFSQHGLLRREQNRLQFPDEQRRFYVNGGWLEILLFDAVRKQRKKDPHIHDIARGVQVSRDSHGKTIPNELDIAFLRNNRLHIIECKTAKFRGEGEDSPGAEALYKLDTLADLMGGLKARTMLASYQDIAVHDRARARDLGIAICSGQQLQHLSDHIRSFTHD